MPDLRRLFTGRPASVSHAQAQGRPGDGVTIYWRPGCTFCQLLTARVRSYSDRAAWVNIWQDPEGAAYVRSVNGGNEVVPTVVMDGVAHTNPSPSLVREALRRLG